MKIQTTQLFVFIQPFLVIFNNLY